MEAGATTSVLDVLLVGQGELRLADSHCQVRFSSTPGGERIWIMSVVGLSDLWLVFSNLSI